MNTPDFIPDGQMPDMAPQAATPGQSPNQTPDFIPDGQFPGEGTDRGAGVAALEGAGQGIAGPLAPWFEKEFLLQKPEDIRATAEAHPVASGAGQVGGFLTGALTGTGEAALMEEAGKTAAGAAGLGNLAKEAPLLSKVGSSAVRNATEMAVMQSGDETSKMILQDPDASAESAIANIGLASVLGGTAGAAITGAVGGAGKLWEATNESKLGKYLQELRNRLDGGAPDIVPKTAEALQNLNIVPDPVLRGVFAGDPKSIEIAQDLYRAQNKEFSAVLKGLPEEIKSKVGEALGPLDELGSFSKAEEGSAAREAFIKEVDDKYGPIAEKLKARDDLASTINVPDEERRNFASRLMDHAINEVGTDSPYYKTYENYAQRVMAKDTIGGLDKLKTELSQNFSVGANQNEKQAWKTIRQKLSEFQDQMIDSHAAKLETDASQAGKGLGESIKAERLKTNQAYAAYRAMMEDLSDHAGLPSFEGTGTLKQHLSENLSPEQFLNKFSPKGNAEAIPFLEKNSPETAAKVRDFESKQFASKFVKNVGGEPQVDYKGLAKKVTEIKKGQPEYLNYVMSQESQKRVESAQVLHDAMTQITNIKDSGTAGGLGKVFSHVGAGAGGMLGYLMGHGVIGSAIIGQAAQYLSKDAPEAIKLAYLKFLGSDQSVKSKGFKAAVDYLESTIRGAKRTSVALGNVLKPGVQVLTSDQMPAKADREKLDKQVSKMQTSPEYLFQATQGDLGHYMPDHHQAAVKALTSQMQYLQSIKPQDRKLGPLDKPIPPSDAARARYNRALDIANKPTIVLQRIKDGTLQTSDLVDLKAMYPASYNHYVTKLMDQMSKAGGEETPIPYNTRKALSMFMGQPLDSTMTPQAIQAAQPLPPQPPQQSPRKSKPSAKAGTSMEKGAKSYQTASQSAESDRTGRD